MKKYIKKINGDKIIFKNTLNNLELVVMHIDSEYSFDIVSIDEKYDLDFIDYVIKELKKSNDIKVLHSSYYSSDLEKMLLNNGLKLSNYNYTIRFTKVLEKIKYDVSNTLDLESKNFYHKMINNILESNHNYLYPNKKYDDNYEKILKFHNTSPYRIYRKNNKVVGIVNYQNFDDNNNISIYSNKLCIKIIFGEDKTVVEDIIKDLLNTYQKDILISTVYVEKDLQDIVQNMKAHFDYGQYILTDEN